MAGYLDDDPPGFDESEYGTEFDEGLDPEGPSRDDLERFGSEYLTCPECGSDVYDQAPICPECGHIFRNQTSATPVWLVVTALAVVACILALIFVF